MNNFNAFQFFGLWLAVKIIPPSAFFSFIMICVVGVVDKPVSMTLIPKLIKVDLTSSKRLFPEILPSRPTTTVLLFFLVLIHVPYALTYLTTSIGVKLV